MSDEILKMEKLDEGSGTESGMGNCGKENSGSLSQWERSERVLGKESILSLHNKHVAVFGIGGVGGYVCEALARAGLGKLTIVDGDDVNITNINRQIIALHSTLDQPKVYVMKNRLVDINPDIDVEVKKEFFLPENSHEYDFTDFDYVADCVDMVTAKIEIIKKAKEAGVLIISSMGTGNKTDPLRFEIADISKTSVCPLAKVMRRELKKREIYDVPVLFSKEEPVKTGISEPGSLSFVPSAAGLIIAGKIIKDLIGK